MRIPPKFVNKEDIYSCFEIIHRLMTKDLKHDEQAGEVKTQLSYLASSYINNYKPNKSKNIKFLKTLEKDRIL